MSQDEVDNYELSIHWENDEVDESVEDSLQELSDTEFILVDKDKGIHLLESRIIPFETTKEYEGEGEVMEATLNHDGFKGVKGIKIIIGDE